MDIVTAQGYPAYAFVTRVCLSNADIHALELDRARHALDGPPRHDQATCTHMMLTHLRTVQTSRKKQAKWMWLVIRYVVCKGKGTRIAISLSLCLPVNSSSDTQSSYNQVRERFSIQETTIYLALFVYYYFYDRFYPLLCPWRQLT